MQLNREKQILDADWCRQLAPGAPYFQVTYFDGGVNIPEINTLVYLGIAKYDGTDSPAYMFQLAESFWTSGDWSLLDEKKRKEVGTECLISCSDDSVRSLADIDSLIVLMNGLARRMKLGIGWDRVLPDE